jgi:hypothetical protein
MACGFPGNPLMHEQFNLVAGKGRPILVWNDLHGMIQQTDFTEPRTPWPATMVASRTGAFIPENGDLWIACFREALDINPAALLLRNRLTCFERLSENRTVVSGARDGTDTVR